MPLCDTFDNSSTLLDKRNFAYHEIGRFYIQKTWMFKDFSRKTWVVYSLPSSNEASLLLWRSSGPEFYNNWFLKRPASGWGLLWESSSFVPWCILNTFRDVSEAVLEWPWISGFMRKSSSRASAPSMPFCVLLNSCDNFSVNLPSISSETWIM